MYKKLSILLFSIVLLACDREDSDGEASNSSFEVTTLLIQSADEYIVPAYKESSDAVKNLISKKEVFFATISEESLIELQNAYRESFKSWQKSSPFDFGPAEKECSFVTVFSDINKFPVDVSLTEEYIATGNTSFRKGKEDTRGFSTLGYLLFDGGNENVLLQFQDNNRRQYASAIIEDIDDRINCVLSGWQGGYRDEFVSENKTNAGSAVSLLYNQFLKNFERIKNFKLSRPAGIISGQNGPSTFLLEAYYDETLSKELIKVNLEAIEAIWYGRSLDGRDGVGFQEWLESKGSQDVVNSTITAFGQLKSKIDAIEEASLEEAINNDLPSIDDLVLEFQKSTRYLKSDLYPVIRVPLTFESGDGD
jgi:predicted lipoprotein